LAGAGLTGAGTGFAGAGLTGAGAGLTGAGAGLAGVVGFAGAGLAGAGFAGAGTGFAGALTGPLGLGAGFGATPRDVKRAAWLSTAVRSSSVTSRTLSMAKPGSADWTDRDWTEAVAADAGPKCSLTFP